MSDRPTPETDAAEYLISIGRKNDVWVVRSDVSRKLEHELAEAREDATNYYARSNELMDFGNKLADECDRILGLGLHQNTLPRFKAALEAWRKNT